MLIIITPINAKSTGSHKKIGSGRYSTPNDQGYTLKDLCKKIVDVAQYYGIPYIDNSEYSVVNECNINYDSLFYDGLHPNKELYLKLGQFYAAKIGSIYRPLNR